MLGVWCMLDGSWLTAQASWLGGGLACPASTAAMNHEPSSTHQASRQRGEFLAFLGARSVMSDLLTPPILGWLQKGGLPAPGFREGSRRPQLTFPRAVLIFGISPAIGFKTLNQLASGILRVHLRGGNRQTVKTLSFRFGCIFLRICSFPCIVETVETVKTVKPASWVPSVFEKSLRRTLGNRQNRQFFQKGPPIGSKEHLLTPRLLTPRLAHPDTEGEGRGYEKEGQKTVQWYRR